MPSNLLAWMVCYSARISATRLWWAAIIAVCDFARNLSCKELWVYTDATDKIAIKFYASLGLELLGPAIEWAPGRTIDDSDLVSKRML
jgi:hypothetical protein